MMFPILETSTIIYTCVYSSLFTPSVFTCNSCTTHFPYTLRLAPWNRLTRHIEVKSEIGYRVHCSFEP